MGKKKKKKSATLNEISSICPGLSASPYSLVMKTLNSSVVHIVTVCSNLALGFMLEIRPFTFNAAAFTSLITLCPFNTFHTVRNNRAYASQHALSFVNVIT